MNNKGFAVSGILYTILLIFITMTMMLLFDLQNKKTVLDEIKSDTVYALDSDSSCEALLERLEILEQKVAELEAENSTLKTSLETKANLNGENTFNGVNSFNNLVRVTKSVDLNNDSFNNAPIVIQSGSSSYKPMIGFHIPGVIGTALYLDNDGYFKVRHNNGNIYKLDMTKVE